MNCFFVICAPTPRPKLQTIAHAPRRVAWTQPLDQRAGPTFKQLFRDALGNCVSRIELVFESMLPRALDRSMLRGRTLRSGHGRSARRTHFAYRVTTASGPRARFSDVSRAIGLKCCSGNELARYQIIHRGVGNLGTAGVSVFQIVSLNG